MKVLLTGASGYLGRAITSELTGRGIDSAPLTDVSNRSFRLGSPPNQDQLQKADVLIHLAWSRSRNLQQSERLNVEGATGLLHACTTASTRFLFVSSYSVVFSPATRYARQKGSIESMTLAAGGTVARIGLVWDENVIGGPLGGLVRLARMTPLVPLPTGRERYVHIARLDDVAEAIVSLALNDTNQGEVIHLSSPRPVALATLISCLASRKRLHFIRIPLRAILWGVAASGALRLTNLTVDNARGLLDSTAVADDLLGVLPQREVTDREDR